MAELILSTLSDGRSPAQRQNEKRYPQMTQDNGRARTDRLSALKKREASLAAMIAAEKMRISAVKSVTTDD
jgi:hypothetical protein